MPQNVTKEMVVTGYVAKDKNEKLQTAENAKVFFCHPAFKNICLSEISGVNYVPQSI